MIVQYSACSEEVAAPCSIFQHAPAGHRGYSGVHACSAVTLPGSHAVQGIWAAAAECHRRDGPVYTLLAGPDQILILLPLYLAL